MDYLYLEWEWVFLKMSRDINTYHAEFGKDVKFHKYPLQTHESRGPQTSQFLHMPIFVMGQHLAFLCETLRNY